MNFKRIIRFLLTFAGVCVAGVQAQQTVVVTSSQGTGGAGVYSTGSAWTFDRSFRFEVGLFVTGFDPAKQPKSSWAAAWTPVTMAAPGVVDSWFSDGTAGFFSISGSTDTIADKSNLGTQYYVWGYSTKSLAGTAEWILLTNPAWIVQPSTTPLVSFFDTTDSGTVAVIGALTNAGKNLQSALVDATLEIRSTTGNIAVTSGGSAVIRVGVNGENLAFQWYQGASGDTSKPVAGATKSSLAISSVTTSGTYWVRVTDGRRTADSTSMTVAPAQVGAVLSSTQTVASLGYIPGGRVAVSIDITVASDVSRLDLSVLPPTGWTLVTEDAATAALRPSLGTADVLDWSWTNAKAGKLSLRYVMAVPASASGGQNVTALVAGLVNGVTYQSLSKTDPLLVPPGPLMHSADTDQNRRISLLELTRVIELYATRNGSVRTGAYAVSAGGEDGFAPDAARLPATSGQTLSALHTADTSRDGRIDLMELLRVIEIFNYRVGTVRTGDYFPRGDTEDGFVAGVAP